MESKVYKYMDWPEIEAVVYAEEASPKDLMAPRLTADGILIQGFFPDAEKAEVLVDKKAYEMEKQDDAGYFAAMIPGRKIPAYQYRITRGEEIRIFADPYAYSLNRIHMLPVRRFLRHRPLLLQIFVGLNGMMKPG